MGIGQLIDRAIGVVSPSAALGRAEARTRLAASASVFGGGGGYRGAQGDRTKRRGMTARARSANADILPGAARMRAEQRDAAMNQPIATAAIGRVTTFTIGTGLMAIPSIDFEALGITEEAAKALEARIARDFDAYMSSKDPDAARATTGYGLQQIMLRARLMSGGSLALRVMPEGQPGRLTETAWRLVEIDRLRNPPSVADGAQDPRSGRTITGGIETDAYDCAVVYHVLREHPGGLQFRSAGSLIPEPIEAWDADNHLPRVIHGFLKERPEQLLGVGLLAPVLEPLKMISDATDAELYASVMSAMLAVVYKSPGAQPMPEPDYGEGDGESGGEAYADEGGREPGQYQFESGTVLEIDSDHDVEIKSPGRPNSAFDPFFLAIVRQIGAATGIPFEVMLLMFNSSYTASRAALETFYTQIVRPERDWCAQHWCTDTYVCWLAEKVARRDYDMPGFFQDLALRAAWAGVNWRGDGKVSLDPGREAAAFEKQEAHGWKTAEEITAELTGANWADNVRKRGNEHRAWVAEGLPVTLPAGAPAAAQSGKSEKSESGDEEEKDGE